MSRRKFSRPSRPPEGWGTVGLLVLLGQIRYNETVLYFRERRRSHAPAGYLLLCLCPGRPVRRLPAPGWGADPSGNRLGRAGRPHLDSLAGAETGPEGGALGG